MLKKMMAAVLTLSILLSMSVTALAASPVTLRVDAENADVLPLRVVAEGLGADVSWNENTRTATVTRGDLVLNIQIDSPLPGGTGSPTIIGGRTFVPAAFLEQQFDVNIDWNPETSMVYISPRDQAAQQPVVDTPEPTVDPEPADEVVEEDEEDAEEADEEETETAAASAYEIFNAANDALVAAGSLSMATESLMVVTVETEEGEVSVEIEMSGTIDQVIHSETNIDMRMEMVTTVEGESFTSLSYIRDGIMYVELFGEWTSMALPFEDIIAQTGRVDFAEDSILNQQISETAAGTVLNFTISGSAMTDMANTIFGTLEAMGLGQMDMTIGDVTVYSIVDADGVLRSSVVEMDMVMEVEGITVVATMLTNSEVTRLGNVVINFPDILDEIE